MLRALDERFYATEDDLRERVYTFAKVNGWI